MDSRTIKALEVGKVLEHLAGLCVSEAGRRVSLGLFPLRDADAVNAAHTLFDEVRTWSTHSGFRLSDFPDLEGLFPHLEKAAVSPSSAPLDADALWALRETLLQGRKEQLPEGSYTTYLFQKGLDKILKKVGEESTEVIIAAKGGEKAETVYEISDLAYHVMVMMVEMGITNADILNELAARHVIDKKVKQEKMTESI